MILRCYANHDGNADSSNSIFSVKRSCRCACVVPKKVLCVCGVHKSVLNFVCNGEIMRQSLTDVSNDCVSHMCICDAHVISKLFSCQIDYETYIGI